MKQQVLIGGICLLLVACSTPSYVDRTYAASRNGPVVQVPPPLSKQDFSQYYILPNVKGPTAVSIAPPV